MAMNPDVLLLDEPLSQLDPIASTQFISLLVRINKEPVSYTHLKSVDFPLPELPQSITNSPLFILSEISESAFLSQIGRASCRERV